MSILNNDIQIITMYFGNNLVDRVYLSDTLVFGTELNPSSDVVVTADNKGVTINSGVNITSFYETSGQYILPTSITINDISINQYTTTTDYNINYTSGVTEQQTTYQTGNIFSGSPSGNTNTTYDNKVYRTISTTYQYSISTFNYSGSGYKSIVTERFPNGAGLPSGTYNGILGAFNINTSSNVDYVEFNTTVQIQQKSSASNLTTVNSLYAVDANGNVLQEFPNINLTSGTKYFYLNINSSTPLPVYLLADINHQDTAIDIFIKGYCRNVTHTDNYNVPLYLDAIDFGDMGMGREIQLQTSTSQSSTELCSLKINTDGTIYDLIS